MCVSKTDFKCFGARAHAATEKKPQRIQSFWPTQSFWRTRTHKTDQNILLQTHSELIKYERGVCVCVCMTQNRAQYVHRVYKICIYTLALSGVRPLLFTLALCTAAKNRLVPFCLLSQTECTRPARALCWYNMCAVYARACAHEPFVFWLFCITCAQRNTCSRVERLFKQM